MKPYYQSDSVCVYNADVLDALRAMPSESVHCVITSPPYHGLRDYGTAKWEGGSAECDHKERNARNDPDRDTRHTDGRDPATQGLVGCQDAIQYRDTCRKCGAVRVDKQIGLEPTFNDWLVKMVEVFREVKRVLRSDGTCWINCGDGYAGSQQTGGNGKRRDGGRKRLDELRVSQADVKTVSHLPPKSLLMMPARLAIAMQEDGWLLRSDIAWVKRAPMPESVRDRPSKSYEHLFMFAKSGRYYYDAFAVREPAQDWGTRDRSNMRNGTTDPKLKHHGLTDCNSEASGRNLRDVWWLSPEPSNLSHYAAYPRALVRPCIRAGTSEKGCCPKCGAGWVRVTAIEDKPLAWKSGNPGLMTIGKSYHKDHGEGTRGCATLGWKPGCACGIDTVEPATVLDIFLGSGTTALVAIEEGRRCWGIELNRDYCDMAVKRLRDRAPLFATAGEGEGLL